MFCFQKTRFPFTVQEATVNLGGKKTFANMSVSFKLCVRLLSCSADAALKCTCDYLTCSLNVLCHTSTAPFYRLFENSLRTLCSCLHWSSTAAHTSLNLRYAWCSRKWETKQKHYHFTFLLGKHSSSLVSWKSSSCLGYTEMLSSSSTHNKIL